ncbi:response regulator [Desulfotignum phosphitoxidans]|uniref:Cytidylate kinase domain-containing containing n=1 Tax=Desulfotignum phosphitoxidans DSM 13687 TaxID=1286635 RepID=S0FVL1_9BACT|nr:response regulator [Desulfotignum phosphitoxidans]EMS79123.1 cytidylate kinase domain-containing containing [Desulfotignum phosphitoxidans DSM 13687]
MPVITIFSGVFCKKKPVLEKIMEKIKYDIVTDNEIISEASWISGMPENKIKTAFSSKVSVFNKFTHEKERATAWIKLALARMLSKDNLIVEGLSSQLIPKEITHVLRICIIADMKFRIMAAKEEGKSEKEAISLIHSSDKDRSSWVYDILNTKDPWDPSLYDMIIPTDKMDLEEAVALIESHLGSEVIKATEQSKKAAKDFILTSEVEVALAKEGHSVGVNAKDGAVTLSINNHVLMLSRLEDELKAIVEKVPGVTSVETKVGKKYHQADIYRKYDFETPKVLLVDDERKFVQTLSERLMIRDMGSAVAYDGESALDMINDDEPEVMILDLKMPGINGIEVLRKVKETRPEIEVIILTGQGSEEDRKICMDLGAFAYLHKPVKIDFLSETLKKAKEKMEKARELKKGQ